MRAFVRETSTVIFVPGLNCDTDQILPGRFLKEDRAQGYGRFLFHDLRHDAEGGLRPEFALNRPGADAARFLLVEDNFGCGSSREGAVYALVDHGFRVLLGQGFGDIFYSNALKNGLLPVRLAPGLWRRLHAQLEVDPGCEITLDLAQDCLHLPGDLGTHPLDIDAFARDCILRGLDELELTMAHLSQIEAFEAGHIARHPWILR